jgi:hypothetical protein
LEWLRIFPIPPNPFAIPPVSEKEGLEIAAIGE